MKRDFLYYHDQDGKSCIKNIEKGGNVIDRNIR